MHTSFFIRQLIYQLSSRSIPVFNTYLNSPTFSHIKDKTTLTWPFFLTSISHWAEKKSLKSSEESLKSSQESLKSSQESLKNSRESLKNTQESLKESSQTYKLNHLSPLLMKSVVFSVPQHRNLTIGGIFQLALGIKEKKNETFMQ